MSDTQGANGTVGKIVANVKKIKHIEIIIAVGAVVLMLVIYFASLGAGESGGGTSSASGDVSGIENYCGRLQAQLEDAISKMSGAGKAKVLISWESSIELILAESTSGGGTQSSSPIIVQNSGGSLPVVIKEIYPKAVGALIICQGGNETKIKLNIIMAASTLLDISPDKVMVYAMTK